MADEPESLEDGIEAYQDPWQWIISLLAPLVAMVLFFVGWDAMDATEPARGRAAFMYVLAALTATGGIVHGILRHQEQMVWTGILGGAGGLLLAFVVAGVAQDGYNDIVVPFVMFYFVVPAVVIGYGITMGIMGYREGKPGLLMATIGWSFLVCIGALGAALYHLITLDAQEQRSIEAHEASAATVVVSLLLLSLGSWLARRSMY